MKNIALSASWRSVIPDVNITHVAVDVDNACLWIASERLNADADTEIDVYKRGLPRESSELQDVSVLFTPFPPGISSRDQSHHDITDIHR
jgi:hypothetical protein